MEKVELFSIGFAFMIIGSISNDLLAYWTLSIFIFIVCLAFNVGELKINRMKYGN